MELNVAERGDDSIVVEVKDETVTMTNILSGELWEDDNVSEAAHIKEHPYLEQPKLFVKTSKGKPETAIDKAVDRLIKKTEEFSDKFKKALKE